MADWEDALAHIEAGCKTRNWNSYHADPVDQRAIDAARRLCESLRVTPATSGGVVVYLADEDIQIEIAYDGQLEDFYFGIVDTNRFISRPEVKPE